MTMQINILIADDHTIFRAGLAALLKRIPRIAHVKQASNGKEVLTILETEPMDIILMDITMPVLDGIETTRFITRQYDHVKVIALSMHNDQQHIIDMNAAGASGYLLKNTDIDELKTAIYAVMRGEKYFSKEVSELLLDKILKGGYRRTPPREVEPLTDRDRELIRFICLGHSAAAIGKMLGVAEKTVEGYKARIYQKTGVNNAAALVLYAVKHGIVEG